MKISFYHIAKTAIALSVFLLAGTICNGNQNDDYYFIDDGTVDAPAASIQNDFTNQAAFDLEKGTDEKEKFATPLIFTSIQGEFIMCGNWPAMCRNNIPHQIHISVFRIDLPPPDFH